MSARYPRNHPGAPSVGLSLILDTLPPESMASAPKVTLSVPPNHGVRLVFGTMTFAGQVDEKSAVEQLETFFAWHPAESYVELDTAFMYEDTRTEQMLGRILTEEEKSRMRIATKGTVLLHFLPL